LGRACGRGAVMAARQAPCPVESAARARRGALPPGDESRRERHAADAANGTLAPEAWTARAVLGCLCLLNCGVVALWSSPAPYCDHVSRVIGPPRPTLGPCGAPRRRLQRSPDCTSVARSSSDSAGRPSECQVPRPALGPPGTPGQTVPSTAPVAGFGLPTQDVRAALRLPGSRKQPLEAHRPTRPSASSHTGRLARLRRQEEFTHAPAML